MPADMPAAFAAPRLSLMLKVILLTGALALGCGALWLWQPGPLMGLGTVVGLWGLSILAFRALISRPLVQLASHYSASAPEGGDVMAHLDHSFRHLSDRAAQAAQDIAALSPKAQGFDSAPHPLLITDPAMQITHCNPAASALLQQLTQDHQSLIGRSLSSLDPMLRSAAGTGQHLLKMGQEHLKLLVEPRRDGTQKPAGYTVACQQETQALLHTSLAQAVDGHQLRVNFSSQGQISSANSLFAQFFGESPPSLVGRDLSRTLVDAMPQNTALWQRLRGNQPFRAQVKLAGNKRDDILLDADFAPLATDPHAPSGWIMLARDMTQILSSVPPVTPEQDSALNEAEALIAELHQGVKKLAKGDLTTALSATLPRRYKDLGEDFGKMVQTLCEAVGKITQSAQDIQGESKDITQAFGRLEDGYARKAQSVTSAVDGLKHMGQGLTSSMKTATLAGEMAQAAQLGAANSDAVVNDAVSAMGEIEQSSAKISRITSVLEEIAFQTNLLALNAGVEAARAGEAGRGFAVVASEVRALAQRSSAAAREIASLITASTDQVQRGVALVAQAGQSLTGIRSSVTELHQLVARIGTDTHEHTRALAGLSTSFTQVDQVEQQNAAALRTASNAATALVQATEALGRASGFFATGMVLRTPQLPKSSPPASSSTAAAWVKSAAPKAAQAPSKAAPTLKPNAAPRMPRMAATTALSRLAPAEGDGWEDF